MANVEVVDDQEDLYQHMFEKKRGLTREQSRLYRQFSESYCLSYVLSYLGQRHGLRL